MFYERLKKTHLENWNTYVGRRHRAVKDMWLEDRQNPWLTDTERHVKLREI